MSGIMKFGSGYDVQNIGGMGRVWEEAPPRRSWRNLWRGRTSERASAVQLRIAHLGLSSSLPSFIVRGSGHAGLLAMPSDFEERVGRDFQGQEVRPAVISRTTNEGWAVAGVLPVGIVLGTARLSVVRQQGEPRVLATPGPDEDSLEEEVRTVLFRFRNRSSGTVPATLGLLIAEKAIALPNRLAPVTPVSSMPLSPKLIDWAIASNTPIV